MHHTNSAVPAAYLILENDGKVLMSIRKNTKYCEGMYQLPAGHVDEGELPMDCVIRESKEEAGIEVAKEDLEFVHISYRTKHDATRDRVDFFFRATRYLGQIQNSEPQKSTPWEWIPLDKIPENTIPHVRRMFEKIREHIIFDQMGLDWLSVHAPQSRV